MVAVGLAGCWLARGVKCSQAFSGLDGGGWARGVRNPAPAATDPESSANGDYRSVYSHQLHHVLPGECGDGPWVVVVAVSSHRERSLAASEAMNDRFGAECASPGGE